MPNILLKEERNSPGTMSPKTRDQALPSFIVRKREPPPTHYARKKGGGASRAEGKEERISLRQQGGERGKKTDEEEKRYIQPRDAVLQSERKGKKNESDSHINIVVSGAGDKIPSTIFGEKERGRGGRKGPCYVSLQKE